MIREPTRHLVPPQALWDLIEQFCHAMLETGHGTNLLIVPTPKFSNKLRTCQGTHEGGEALFVMGEMLRAVELPYIQPLLSGSGRPGGSTPRSTGVWRALRDVISEASSWPLGSAI